MSWKIKKRNTFSSWNTSKQFYLMRLGMEKTLLFILARMSVSLAVHTKRRMEPTCSDLFSVESIFSGAACRIVREAQWKLASQLASWLTLIWQVFIWGAAVVQDVETTQLVVRSPSHDSFNFHLRQFIKLLEPQKSFSQHFSHTVCSSTPQHL